jgi:predicted secreted protein
MFRLLIALMFIVMSTAAFGSDMSYYRTIGFSKDGKYFAFERYGTQDGSGFPYSEIFVLDICKNDYANPPIRVTLQEDGNSEENATKTSMKTAKPILDKFKIDVTIKGTSVVQATTRKIIPFQFGGQKMVLTLDLYETENKECWEGNAEKKLTLSLTRKNVTAPLQKDVKVPKSRSCAFSYAVQEAICYNSAIVAILNYNAPGFEGPDTRQIAISGCMK